ncbi:hypothetical protein LMG28688_00813 [Paraburkholderia caffeinitolerans]|uniref:Uncharacterized protein n=1 Tax=Paraburkholderia caffeinitolerans TaxID=1723730 RepID=A0A6J5FIY0_9BURK|nr:hypothetical protein [Paraburkholderia caffeinitolerans]CAB3779350.1 hypothetical protein LMG28688_00813 [Paraburkholderia caffeinitolerans]
MTEEKTFTIAQLREAVILWESDVRANPDAFQSAEDTRAEPIEQCADAYMVCIGSYLDKVATQ